MTSPTRKAFDAERGEIRGPGQKLESAQGMKSSLTVDDSNPPDTDQFDLRHAMSPMPASPSPSSESVEDSGTALT